MIKRVISLLLVSISPCYAATYYIDYTDGDDSNTGLSEALAWRNASKAGGITSGDTVLFQNGEQWDFTAQLNLKNGTSNSPTTYGNYGSGELPRFNNTPTMQFTFYLGNRHHIVMQNLELMGKNTTSEKGDIFADGCNNITVRNCYWNSSLMKIGLQFYEQASTGNTRDIVVENCTFYNSSDTDCIRFNPTVSRINNLTVNNCTFDHIHGNAVRVFMGCTTIVNGFVPNNVRIIDNTFNVTDFCAINVHSGDDFRIAGNKGYQVGNRTENNVNAFQLNNLSNSVVENNYISEVYSNEPDGVGIIIDWGWSNNSFISHNVTVRNNFIQGCNGCLTNDYVYGISLYKADHSKAYNNVVIDSGGGIVNSNSNCVWNEIYHNTIDNVTHNGIKISGNNITVKNNIINNTEDSSGIAILFGSTDITENYNAYNNTFSDFYDNQTKTATYGANSFTKALGFGTNYTLSKTSPCRNNGTGVGIGNDFVGTPRDSQPDIGAYEYYGSKILNATIR